MMLVLLVVLGQYAGSSTNEITGAFGFVLGQQVISDMALYPSGWNRTTANSVNWFTNGSGWIYDKRRDRYSLSKPTGDMSFRDITVIADHTGHVFMISAYAYPWDISAPTAPDLFKTTRNLLAEKYAERQPWHTFSSTDNIPADTVTFGNSRRSVGLAQYYAVKAVLRLQYRDEQLMTRQLSHEDQMIDPSVRKGLDGKL